MGALGNLLHRKARAEVPDHRTDAVLAKLDAAVAQFQQSKQRVDRAFEADEVSEKRVKKRGQA
jgi:hypothetical protein